MTISEPTDGGATISPGKCYQSMKMSRRTFIEAWQSETVKFRVMDPWNELPRHLNSYISNEYLCIRGASVMHIFAVPFLRSRFTTVYELIRETFRIKCLAWFTNEHDVVSIVFHGENGFFFRVCVYLNVVLYLINSMQAHMHIM